ncbi:MAG: hypothetical protein WAV73_05875 [Candidatus Moraniibacteriota bacterium]
MEKNLDQFLEKHNKTKKEFTDSGYVWDDLLKIAEDYKESLRDLEPVAKYFVERIKELEGVHSVWYRLKDQEHLIEKIIRKHKEDVDKNEKDESIKIRKITLENYKSEITDLIGIRILHLFKEDWSGIHEFIGHLWDIKGRPIAYIRDGDDSDYVKIFEEKGCEINRERRYRSVHYIIKSKPYKELYVSEIQVRTIFEEGWSAIDHEVIYPTKGNDILVKQLSILNRLAGAADEMGSFVRFLKDYQEKNKKEVIEFKKEIEELKKTQPDAAKKIEESVGSLLDFRSSLMGIANPMYSVIDGSKLMNSLNMETHLGALSKMAESSRRAFESFGLSNKTDAATLLKPGNSYNEGMTILGSDINENK